MSKLVITNVDHHEKEHLAAALVEQGRVSQFHFLKIEKKSILGNIYIGKVKNIVKNIRAAFIEIADGMMCYYAMDEKAEPIFVNPKKDSVMKIGDEVLVQVSKERMKTKLPSVSSNLNFTGRFFVLTTQRKELGFSSKLSKEEKNHLRQMICDYLPKDVGVIVRTNARDANEEDLIQELQQLSDRYETLLHKAKTRVCFSLLEEQLPEYLQIIQNTYLQGLEEIVTDIQEIYEKVSQYQARYNKNEIPLRRYEDPLLPLGKLYSLNTVLENSLKERVWLPSGGFLIIQQTEAFVCIDVNTGKYSEKKDIQDTFRKINIEAAKEIAWQLRLRNLSGIILIDFINMKHKEDEQELLSTLQSYLKKDPVKSTVVDITSLKIVEVTRKKVKKSLKEEMNDLE